MTRCADAGEITVTVPTQPPVPQPALELVDVTKRYGKGSAAVAALDPVSLTVTEGEFVCLVGSSGCGKSTLLSIIAGLDAPSSGTVETFGRRVALMFQEPALFPWLTAAANVDLALRARAVPRDVRRERVARLLTTVGLAEFAGKRPHQLSGGMRQRVALARALAQDADVLLMDEPCSALDPISTLAIEDLIAELKQDFTIVIVTHNMQQAARVSDQTAFFNLEATGKPGQLIEIDDTEKIFSNPSKKATEDYISGRFG